VSSPSERSRNVAEVSGTVLGSKRIRGMLSGLFGLNILRFNRNIKKKIRTLVQKERIMAH
jgi:hypothetical protein